VADTDEVIKMKKKNFVVTECNNYAQVTLLFKAIDEDDCIERWRAFYEEECYDKDEKDSMECNDAYNGEEGYYTTTDVHIFIEDISECTDAEMKTLSKFCSVMYSE
jgi:hypothetical protein